MISLKHLPNTLPNEQVILFLRRHWIDLLAIFAFSALLLLIPAGLGAAIEWFAPTLLAHIFWGPLLFLLLSAYLLMVMVVTMTEVTDYWLDTWIVTTERIINIEQHGLFKRHVSELMLNQIQDVTSETHGLLETFLTFGDVFIQSAAEKLRFHFKNVDNPETVKQTLLGLVQTCRVTHKH